jgi:hypothetical protein
MFYQIKHSMHPSRLSLQTALLHGLDLPLGSCASLLMYYRISVAGLSTLDPNLIRWRFHPCHQLRAWRSLRVTISPKAAYLRMARETHRDGRTSRNRHPQVGPSAVPKHHPLALRALMPVVTACFFDLSSREFQIDARPAHECVCDAHRRRCWLAQPGCREPVATRRGS